MKAKWTTVPENPATTGFQSQPLVLIWLPTLVARTSITISPCYSVVG